MGQAAIIEEKLKRAEYGEGAAATIAAELGISRVYVFKQSQIWDTLIDPRINSITSYTVQLSGVKWYFLALTAPALMAAIEHAEAEWDDPKLLRRYTTIEFQAWINAQRRKAAVEAATDLPNPPDVELIHGSFPEDCPAVEYHQIIACTRPTASTSRARWSSCASDVGPE